MSSGFLTELSNPELPTSGLQHDRKKIKCTLSDMSTSVAFTNHHYDNEPPVFLSNLDQVPQFIINKILAISSWNVSASLFQHDQTKHTPLSKRFSFCTTNLSIWHKNPCRYLNFTIQILISFRKQFISWPFLYHPMKLLIIHSKFPSVTQRDFFSVFSNLLSTSFSLFVFSDTPLQFTSIHI